jgi:hypothetical protein
MQRLKIKKTHITVTEKFKPISLTITNGRRGLHDHDLVQFDFSQS